MPRIVGIFEDGSAVEGVVEQLQLNGLTQVTVIGPEQAAEEQAQHLSIMHVPDQQAAEYRRRLQDQRWLLFVQVTALELPTAQRALRAGEAIDIDLLPEGVL
ncbi:MAG: hypothetical protein M3R24_21880 [Chloroflexota bacterium]|nr:hypothetical protein [Chloroflexota bacterium]PLS80357.1 MAG: hypothetical protein CYG59_08345 [Chloroflexota bacterium]